MRQRFKLKTGIRWTSSCPEGASRHFSLLGFIKSISLTRDCGFQADMSLMRGQLKVIMLSSHAVVNGVRDQRETFGLRLGALGVIASISVTLVGCVPVLPTRPDLRANISMTVEGGHFAFVQCIDSTYTIDYISIMAGPTVNGSRERLLLSGLEVGKCALLQYRQPMTISQLGKLMSPSVIHDIEVTKFGKYVSLTLALNGPRGRVEMSFLEVETSSLEPGKYVHESGEVNDHPCDPVTSSE